MSYLNFILTVLCLLLGALLVSGYFLVKKIGKYLTQQKINPQAFEQTQQLMSQMKQMGNMFGNMPRK
jgi:uncharacterized protein YneF (UPF0154 family)